MGVFDPRQGQVLPSPVTNFYKGKAIRQELAGAEQMAEMRGLQIDEAKYQQSQRPKQEEILDLKLNAAKQGIEAAELKYGEEKMAFMAKSLAPITSEAAMTAIKGDLEGAVSGFNERIKSLMPNLPKEIQEAVKANAGEDHVYDFEEISDTMLMLSAWGEKQNLEKKSQAFMVDGKPVQGWKDDFGNYYLSDGKTLATGNIAPFATGRSEFDPDANKDPRTDSQYGADFSVAKEEYDDSSDLREMVFDFMPKAIKLPDAVGGMAKLAQNVASLATALGQDATADMIMQNLTKTDQETLSAMQTQLSLIRSRVRPIATGDSGTRQSESERQLANQVVQLTENLDSPAEILKNYPRAMGALKQLAVETLVRQYQTAKRWDEIDAPYDLTSDSGKRELLTDLSNAGFDEGTALEALKRLELIQSGK